MNVDSYELLLILVITWPLLLALPAIHNRLPFAHYLILAPTVLLVLLPAKAAITPVWLFFGAGFEFDNSNRYLLIMAIVIWFAAATTYKNANKNLVCDRTFSFFSLTLAGHLGTLLSADIVSFFCCSTLMGYGFYGLLLRQKNTAPNWAGRFYISFLIIADLLLFESILLAAYGTDQLKYTLLHHAIIDGHISIFYVWLVSIAFIIKAGIWPAHIWLTTSFNSAARPAYILLGGVPVVTGLLGLIRWIPAGEMIVSEWGMYFQILGIITLLFALIQLIKKGYQTMLPALVTLFMTGLFMVGLGTSMARPEMWTDYHFLAQPYLALLGVISATVCFTMDNQAQAGGNLLKKLIERGLKFMSISQNVQLPSFAKLLDNMIKFTKWSGLIDVLENKIRCWPVISTILVLFMLTIIFLSSITTW